MEGETHDRTNTSLTGYQLELATEILALGRPVAIVLLNGGPVSLDTLSVTAPAILEVFYPGYQGNAEWRESEREGEGEGQGEGQGGGNIQGRRTRERAASVRTGLH